MKSAKVFLLAVCAISAFSQASSLKGNLFVVILKKKANFLNCQMAGQGFWEENTSPARII